MSQSESNSPVEKKTEIDRIRQVYEGSYKTQVSNREHIWHPRNPVSVYYRQTLERALIELFNQYDLSIEKLRVIDVGCGMGNFLRFLISLQALPNHLSGIDLMPYRIHGAKKASPQDVSFLVGDASCLPYSAGSYDIASQFTVLSSVLDTNMRGQIAREMCRVVSKNGYILWYDLISTRQVHTRGIDLAELRSLFPPCKLIYARKLHTRFSSRIAPRSLFLASLWDRLPGIPKTHYLALLQQNI